MHFAILTYLRLLNLRPGMLLNFNCVHMKDGIKRIINSLYHVFK
ncbi:MAG: GxxExxY protein [Flavisolibacter sp.]